MRIAVIEWNRREYVRDVVRRNGGSDVELVCFAGWDWDEPIQNPSREEDDIPISKLKSVDFDAVLIAVRNSNRLSKLLNCLHEEGIHNIYVVRYFSMVKKIDFMQDGKFISDSERVIHLPESDDRPYLVYLETHVCDYCNLNCKACTHCSPFVEKKTKTDPQRFEEDLARLSNMFCGIDRFKLLGGEPLLEPDLCLQMGRLVRKYFPDTEIRIATNALLADKMPEYFWETLRELGIIFNISFYAPLYDKLSMIESLLDRHQVKSFIIGKVDFFDKYWTLGDSEDAEYNNLMCTSSGCHYLREGKIWKCPDSFCIGYMARSLGRKPEELMSKQVFDLEEVKDPWKLVRMLYSPIDMCSRCSYARIDKIPWGIAGKEPDVSDWFISE